MYHILFVDDEPAINFIVSKYKCWNDVDFTLKKSVTSGKDALEELMQESYDLVITDIRMPVMDGIELLTEIRKRNIHTSVILCSTYTDFQYAREGMRLGALDYISKPLTEKKLREELEFVQQILFQQKNKEQYQLEIIAGIGSTRQNQVFESILSLGDDAESMIADITQELKIQYGTDHKKIASVLELLYTGIWNQMSDKFPWLAYLASIDISVSPEQYERDVKRILTEMQKVVEKFQIFRHDSVINSICSILTDNLQSNQVIDIISDKLELSADYIRVLFKNKTGMNFNKFLTLLKMEYAKELLKNTNLKIYEIAEKCGYGTIDYFTKLFKTHTGYTPVQYRKMS